MALVPFNLPHLFHSYAAELSNKGVLTKSFGHTAAGPYSPVEASAKSTVLNAASGREKEYAGSLFRPQNNDSR